MSRPLRTEYLDAWYHVMNRSRRSEKAFFDKGGYQAFTHTERFTFFGNVRMEIGDQLDIHKYSSVSSSIERMKRQIADDPKLGKRLEQLTECIRKSQEQT